tara:strand:+ start:1975 stop:2745 length:771 start_codon:yes stop_codon:yes gene_type:complete
MRIEDFLGNQRYEFELRVIIQALKKDGWNAVSWGYDDIDKFDISDVDLRKRPHGQMTYDTGFAQIIDYEEFGIKFEDKNGKTAWIACMLGNGWGELCYDYSINLVPEENGNRNWNINTYYDMNLQEILRLFDVTNTFRIVSLLPKPKETDADYEAYLADEKERTRIFFEQERQKAIAEKERVKTERKEWRIRLAEEYPHLEKFKLGQCPSCARSGSNKGNSITSYTITGECLPLSENQHEVWWRCGHSRLYKVFQE